MKLHKVIFLGLLTMFVFGIGCTQKISKSENQVTSDVSKYSTSDVKECLNKPYDLSWDGKAKHTVSVVFDNKSDEFIRELSNKHKILNLDIIHKSNTLTFAEFLIDNNLQVVEICNFLNDEGIFSHKPTPDPRKTMGSS